MKLRMMLRMYNMLLIYPAVQLPLYCLGVVPVVTWALCFCAHESLGTFLFQGFFGLHMRVVLPCKSPGICLLRRLMGTHGPLSLVSACAVWNGGRIRATILIPT
jgi:hypothetical protein